MNATIFDRRLKRKRNCRAICFIGVLLVLTAAESRADSELHFLRGLVDRHLFESVEKFCETKNSLHPEEKAAFAVESIRSRTCRMLLDEPVYRKESLGRILETEKVYSVLTNEFSKPDVCLAGIRVTFQTDIAVALLGDWRRLEAGVAPESDRETLLREARSTLLDALERFAKTVETICRLRRTVGSNATLELERRMLALERSVRFQWGLCQTAYALTFPPGEDRTLGLRRALEILSEQASLRIDDPSVYQSRIESATGYRLLGELEQSREILDGLQEIESRLAPELRYAVKAERLRCRLAAGEVDEAVRELGLVPDDGTAPPDFELARLELLAALSRRIRESGKGKAAEIAQRENEAVVGAVLNLTRKIERQFGPYWGRRARMAVGSSASRDAAKTHAEVSWELLAVLGEDQYQQGRHAEAVRLFDRASQAAEHDGDSEAAFKNAFSSVAVLSGALDRLEASTIATDEERAACRRRLIESLRNLSKRFFDRPEASELHLKGIDLAADSVLREQLPLSDYLDLLKEHADLWPGSVKVPPLLFRAALLLEQQGRPADALAVLEKIPNGSAVGAEAVKAGRRCFDVSEPRDDSAAAAWFERRLQRAAKTWNEADALSALNASEYSLRIPRRPPGDSGGVPPPSPALRAEQLLRAALEHSENPAPMLKAQLSALLVTALAEQGRKDEGATLLQTLGAEELGKLTVPEQRAFQEVRARLLADTGRVQEAVNLLVELLKAEPKNPAIRQHLAEILTRQNDPRAWEQALRLWTALERDASKDGELWWTARERILGILLKQGKTEEAKKSFELLRTLYPGLGGEGRKVRLEKMFLKTPASAPFG